MWNPGNVLNSSFASTIVFSSLNSPKRAAPGVGGSRLILHNAVAIHLTSHILLRSDTLQSFVRLTFCNAASCCTVARVLR